jgi:hypothetical protein
MSLSLSLSSVRELLFKIFQKLFVPSHQMRTRRES